MINQCIVTGNLGDDPKVFYLPDGNPVASLASLFSPEKRKPAGSLRQTTRQIIRLTDVIAVAGFALKNIRPVSISQKGPFQFETGLMYWLARKKEDGQWEEDILLP